MAAGDEMVVAWCDREQQLLYALAATSPRSLPELMSAINPAAPCRAFRGQTG